VSIIEKAAGKLEKERNNEAEQVPRGNPISSGQKLSDEVDIQPRTSRSVSMEVDSAQRPIPISAVDSAPAPAQTSRRITLNIERMRQYGIVTPDQGRTQIAEQFRVIKRPLLTNAFNRGPGMIKNGNLIMVTSALAGEGKSFCTVNLAMSIAMEMDRTVLLVDADVARPTVPKILGLGTESGLMDILLDEKLDLADVLIKTNIEKLTLLTAGRRHSHSTELLASQSMGELLKELAERYADRVVIFDSPPLLLTSEARVLATQMGQIVLVVEAETTSQQAVKETLRQIESCDVVNLIYNKARSFSGGEYYGYYYHESA
jgi:exopolysaccharide/PEP-CTERM locus tyrosine autokinase